MSIEELAAYVRVPEHTYDEVSEALSNELIKAKTEAYKTGYLEGAVTTYNEYTAQLAQLNPTKEDI